MVEHTCNKEAEIARLTVMVEEIHHKLMGNGNPGLLSKWDNLQGQISVIKFVAGSGLFTGLVSAGLFIWSILR